MTNRKALRKRRPLTQRELVAHLSVRRRQALADWERGAARPLLQQRRARCAVRRTTGDEVRAAADAARDARRRGRHNA